MERKDKQGNVIVIEKVSKRESTTRKLRKRNIRESKDISSTKSENFKSSNEENGKMVKNSLKRKRTANDGIRNKLSSENTISKTLKKLRKRKKLDNSNQNTDTLNLTDLSVEHILQCISAIFHLNEEQLKNKNALFEGESHPIFMQVTCIRVPKTPRRHLRILLPYSIVSEDDEVALFVGDLQRGRRQDNEVTVEHYEELLRKHGCTNIRIISMNQVKTEYDQYELKRKLVGSYDHFLVDGKIVGHLSHLLGREFYKKRKLPTSIRLTSKDLKHEIEYALKKTCMQLHSFGDTNVIQIGHTSMKQEEILENVLATCTGLSKNYPGGWINIRSIRLKTAKSLALPIYTSLKNKNSVKIPMIQAKRPKAYRNVTDELSTLDNDVTVTVRPEGEVIIQRKSQLKRSKINK